ncbi:MAG: putative endonuclease [Bacillales bacterium]|jgi:hypothetical protein|nr:putative endonuclease [Bacillales bacterium]
MKIVVENQEVTLTPLPGPYSNYMVDVVNGRIYNLRKKRFLVSNGDRRFNYCKVTLKLDDGNFKTLGVHELVMASHLGVEDTWWKSQGLEINHISEIKSDNSISNLELCTRKENMNKSRKKLGGNKRLGWELARNIREEFQLSKDKKSTFINYYLTKIEQSFTYSAIENVLNGKTYKIKTR